MRNPFWMTALNAVLAVSVALSVLFCLQFLFVTREARTLSVQLNNINLFRNTLQALANDCVAYSEKNPAIEPILESVGLKPRATGGNTGGKPATNR